MKNLLASHHRFLTVPLAAGLVIAGLFGLSACDMIGSSDSTGDARVRVLLVDEPFPFDLVAEANVTISNVQLIRDDEHYIVMDEEREFNLLELQDGVSALLGEVDVSAGTYSQARLIVEDASIVLNDETTFDLIVPSGSETGIKVLLNDIEFEEGQEITLTLDFDVSQSFIVQGNPLTAAGIDGFIFTPVIIPTSVEFTDFDEADEEEEVVEE